MSFTTLAELFLLVAGRDQPRCLLYKEGEEWRPVSSRELGERVRRLARALEELGLEPGDRVGLMADNGPHWPLVDFATLCLGAVVVPLYPTLTGEQAAFILRDSGAKIAFVAGRERLEMLDRERRSIPELDRLVEIETPGGNGGGETLAGLLAGGEMEGSHFDERARQVRPQDLATLVYTSGTTGRPKGVMLTHGNIASNVVASIESFEVRPAWTALSFLPLSHSFERTIDYTYFCSGLTIAYGESIHTVAEDLKAVEPHIFVSVPRLYEKVHGALRARLAQAPPLRRRLFAWAEACGRRALPYRLRDERPPGRLGIELWLADRLVFSSLRKSLGGRFAMALSGGAPLALDVAELFWAAGLPIYEGYGLTETSPVLTVNTPGAVKLGTVGKAIPGVELHIADDGEVLARGPNILQGYFNDEEATREVLDDDGWFHTGDIGTLDEDGFLSITDRKKELIVNAYGKNIAPAPIENRLKASPLIDQAVVLGDQRPFLAALLVPDFEALAAWAREHQIGAEERSALLADEAVRSQFGSEVASMNAGLAGYEQIRAWELLPAELTQQSGELTPTQKVRRRVINERYREVIEGLYRREAKPGRRAEQ